MQKTILHVLVLVCWLAPSAAGQTAFDMHLYQPLEDLHGKVYEFVDRTGEQPATYFEAYRVMREGGKVLLELSRYTVNGELSGRGLLESRPRGLFWVSFAHRAKGPKAAVEDVSWTFADATVIPWQAKQGDAFRRKFSYRQFYDDQYGYVTYSYDLKLLPDGMSQLTLEGRVYECTKISASGTMSSKLDSGYAYPPAAIAYTYFYARDLGLIRTEVTANNRTSDISLKRIVPLEEFEKIRK